MRIIAGKFRSVALASVGKGDVGAHLRPTTDRVRESLFNVLTHHDVFDGARVLDLFAGTGALGLEVLSRGASHVTFVDNGRAAQALIRQNITKLRVRDVTSTIMRDAQKLGPCGTDAFDLVFLDPPYGKSMGQRALTVLQTGGWIAKDAMIVWEENAPMDPPDGFSLVDRRKYGDTHVTLLTA
ncbi:MAG: 16S rRNA (guanine(966)-N(2))-methyltransferase RsmD [Sulfitobacter sp.]